MAELKTKPTGASVAAFLGSVDHETRRKDARAVVKIMQEITGCKPRMWGPTIIGFDSYRYKYDSGRSGEWPITGMSPRKSALTLYIMPGFAKYDALLAKLGKYKTGRSCLYINKLADVEIPVLKELIRLSVQHIREKYKT